MIALIYGLQVMIVGLLIVFAGLTILIGCIKGMEKVMERLPEWQGKLPTAQIKEKLNAGVAQLKGKLPVNPKKAATENTDELVAVITAAVAAMIAQENAQAAAAAEEGEEPAAEEVKGFVVRSIRRVSTASAWNRAGREEQIYSRL